MSSLELDIFPVVGKAVWPIFAPHHYLTHKFMAHRTFLAALEDGTPVALSSIVVAPSGAFRNGWREHRTVVLPDFQGLGIGVRLGDWVAHWVCSVYTSGEGRYFSRTMHPRLGGYREASPLWRGTSHNRKPSDGQSTRTTTSSRLGIPGRVSFAHEYIGHTL